MRYIHLSHKYDWHHVTDIIIQLYRIMGLETKLKWMSVRSWRWTLLHLPRKPYIGCSGLCSNVSHTGTWHHVFFNYFFSQSFVDSGAIPLLLWRQGEWRFISVNHSLVVLILLFFMLVNLWKGLTRIRLRGWMFDPYVKEHFLTAIPQSSRTKYPTLHCQQYWLFLQNHFHWLAEMWFLVLFEHI